MTASSRWWRTGRLPAPCFAHAAPTHIHGRVGVITLAWLPGASTAPGLAVMAEAGIGRLAGLAMTLWLQPAEGACSCQAQQVDP
jgi:hypothetical protein